MEKNTQVLKRGNITIVVHRPALSEAERQQQEAIIKTALMPFARKEK